LGRRAPRFEPAAHSPAARRRERSFQTCDEAVSRRKFEREVASFLRHQSDYQERGWLLLDATFPTVMLVLCAPQVRPMCVLFGVEIDFTNYDSAPPSVRFVDPFTRALLTCQDLITRLPRRRIPPPLEAPNGHRAAGAGPAVVNTPVLPPVIPTPIPTVDLLQGYGPGDVPFLCVPGVREYHEHPAHSGDVWLLHRGTGAGRLDMLLNVLHQFGVEPVIGYRIEVLLQSDNAGQVRIAGCAITGFEQREFPT
jgi:hypothetical protein